MDVEHILRYVSVEMNSLIALFIEDFKSQFTIACEDIQLLISDLKA